MYFLSLVVAEAINQELVGGLGGLLEVCIRALISPVFGVYKGPEQQMSPRCVRPPSVSSAFFCCRGVLGSVSSCPSALSPPLSFHPCTPSPIARPAPIGAGKLMPGDSDTQMKG